EKKMHALRHDMKHHLVEIGHLASRNDYVRIMKYVNQMNEYIEYQNIYVNSGNKDIDSILNYMLNIAAADGASIETNISIPEEINIQCFDLNVILGNLLDNAIEAIRKSDEKVLAININYEKGVLFINCKNSYTGEIFVEKGKILSSKRNKSMHGIGLDNIKKITEQYHGNVEVEYDSNYFDVTVLLYILN
ncbi:MAG: ATP-binding protein, partial [Bacillota bacterium]|nr:ATP-binding protein [Bacillota bacterium]